MAVWETKDIVVVAAATIGAAASWVGALINHWLNARRLGRERVWEPKRETYGGILADLHESKIQFGLNVELMDFIEWAGPSSGGNYGDGQATWSKALDRHRANSLVCSEPFQNRFSGLEMAMAKALIIRDEKEKATAFATTIDKGHLELMRIAKAELRLP